MVLKEKEHNNSTLNKIYFEFFNDDIDKHMNENTLLFIRKHYTLCFAHMYYCLQIVIFITIH